MKNFDLNAVKAYLQAFQASVIDQIQARDQGVILQTDDWSRTEGGGGRTCVMTEGGIVEKAGVNFSHVWGNQLPQAATLQRPELMGCTYQAMGTSLIIHPLNPFAPTCHANIRFFMAETVEQKVLWWFGGGFDLTPYYGFKEDCIHWHQTAKKACDPFGQNVYERYKKWADDYFYLKHRGEARGIGGLFFDDLNEGSFADCFSFMKSVGDHFPEAYFPILERRQDHPFTQAQRDFQSYRRGRYVEFNLIYDRGTLFGLQSGGRTESILVSLPPVVAWNYDWKPTAGSLEADLYEKYLPPRDWINEK